MARRAIPSPEATEAAQRAADAARRIQERNARRAAKVLADRVERESKAAIDRNERREAELKAEMERLIKSKLPTDEPETVTCHIGPAATAAAALKAGEQALEDRRAERDALPVVPPTPGRVLTLLARLPFLGRLAQDRVNTRQRARRLARAAIVKADAAVAQATTALGPLREEDAEATKALTDARSRWERTHEQVRAFWLKKHAKEVVACRDTVHLLQWRPDYVLRSAEEVAQALRLKPWQDTNDGDGEGTPPPSSGVKP